VFRTRGSAHHACILEDPLQPIGVQENGNMHSYDGTACATRTPLEDRI